jgi:hypothetical protein
LRCHWTTVAGLIRTMAIRETRHSKGDLLPLIYGRTASAFYDRPRVAEMLPELIEKGTITIQILARCAGWKTTRRSPATRTVDRCDSTASPATSPSAKRTKRTFYTSRLTMRLPAFPIATCSAIASPRTWPTPSAADTRLPYSCWVSIASSSSTTATAMTSGMRCCGSWRTACAVASVQATPWQGSGAMNSPFYSPLSTTLKRPSRPYAVCWTSSSTHSSYITSSSTPPPESVLPFSPQTAGVWRSFLRTPVPL